MRLLLFFAFAVFSAIAQAADTFQIDGTTSYPLRAVKITIITNSKFYSVELVSDGALSKSVYVTSIAEAESLERLILSAKAVNCQSGTLGDCATIDITK